jgi:hypothetical protein
MDSSKLCMTREHHLKMQRNYMHKWLANESFIEYECQLNKQTKYEKYAKEFLVTRK